MNYVVKLFQSFDFTEACFLCIVYFMIATVSWAFPVKLPLGEYHKASLMISQHWFK